MPGPEQREVAEIFLRKAASDLAAARALAADRAQDDDVVGFHAQQAVEKSVKAVLVISGVEIPRTHDLAFLVDLATGSGRQVPGSLAAAEWLTPWATALRYDEASGGLDRGEAIEVAAHAVEWAKAGLGQSPPGWVSGPTS